MSHPDAVLVWKEMLSLLHLISRKPLFSYTHTHTFLISHPGLWINSWRSSRYFPGWKAGESWDGFWFLFESKCIWIYLKKQNNKMCTVFNPYCWFLLSVNVMWSAIKYIYITAVLGACIVLHELMVNFSYVVLSSVLLSLFVFVSCEVCGLWNCIFVPCVYP